MTEAEENPLHKKLRLRSDDKGLIVSAPQGDDNPLQPLPDSFTVVEALDALDPGEDQFDYVHVFATDRAELAGTLGTLRDKLAPAGSLWISWLKLSSKRGASQATDLNETIVRRMALTNGLVDVKVAALDRDWSSLLLVHRKH